MEQIATENLSKEEIEFNEMIQKGDDFMKIQIFRSARECYNLALDLNFNNILTQEKLKGCNQNIKSESKTIITILIIFGLIIASVITYLYW
jgi:hypothetical protein